MCRIASHFFYRGWKEAYRATGNFNNIETRALNKSPESPSPLRSKALNEIHAILTEILGKHAPSYATVQNWAAQFKRVDFSTCSAPRPGRPKTVTTPEIIDQIHELILEDQQLSNWAYHVSVLGPSFFMISTCGSSPPSGSQNAWMRITNVNGANRMSNI